MRDDYIHLDEQLAERLARREHLGRLRRLPPRTDKVDFSSNSYLSLSSNSAIKEAYRAQINSLDAGVALGSGGSRLLDGNSSFAEDLEKQIAAFHRGPAALLFNSGFEANTGLFSCVPQVDDVVVYDELVHASIHDGLRLTRASKKIPFAHNNVSSSPAHNEQLEVTHHQSPVDTLPALAQVLQSLVQGESGPKVRSGQANVFIAVESLYSMDGDVAPLEEIVQCISDLLPLGNGYLIVDEAHSTGVFGNQGQGLVCELGIEDKVWARVHTFGKAVDCSGAVVLCSEPARQYLINYARSFIFTTAMSFPTLASIRTSYHFLDQGKAQPLILRLHALSRHCRHQLSALCGVYRTNSGLLKLHIGSHRSPIIALLTTKPRELANHCQQAGYMVRPIVSPTVPKGTERVRICLHVKNTFDQIDGLCSAIEDWARMQSLSDRQRGASSSVSSIRGASNVSFSLKAKI